MLTVMTHLWAQPGGRTRYTAEHVNIWAAMVRRHLTMEHEIACVTDMPEGIDDRVRIIEPPRDFDDVRIPTWGEHMPQCLRRISMYRPDAAEVYGAERFVNMDLDCVISGPLDPLFDRDEDIVLYRGTTQARPYNGSMTMLRAGARPEVFERFTPEGAVVAGQRYLGSDQAWVSHVLGEGEATWGVDDGVHAWGSSWNRGEPRLTFFLTKQKPWEFVVAGEPWVSEHYRRFREGRCLILGYAPHVWDEAYRAGADFEAVIASPEAARHRNAPGWAWGDIEAVAQTDEHALRLARMAGFDEHQIVFCGQQAVA